MKFQRLIRSACLALMGLLAPVASAQVSLEPVLTGLTSPIFFTHAGDGTGRVYVVEQPGTIRIGDLNGDGSITLRTAPFLDITAVVDDSSSEMGLLGIAFHPEYASNGRFFVNYIVASPRRTRIAEYTRSGDPYIANTTEKVILEFSQPQTNHNGGWMDFGPTDGLLYIASGDGGNGGDVGPGHEENVGNGQFLGTLLGKILRIDIDTTGTYLIPPDNPFVGVSGAREEIYAYGLRNPWRCSFERVPPHRLFAGDVGQSAREEIDIITAGANYGWRITEGNVCYNAGSCNTAGLTPPIHDYDRGSGDVAVTGGYVAFAPRLPSYAGQYIFGDYASGRIWALEETTPGTWTRTLLTTLGSAYRTASFGEDGNGNIYVCDIGGRVLRVQEPIQAAAAHSIFYE